jgi:hypothetical protein
MNWRRWLAAFGISEIALGVALLAAGSLVLVRTAGDRTPVFAIITGATLLPAGIGSLRRRNWARILSLIISGACLALGTAWWLIILVMLATAERPDLRYAAMLLGILALFLIALPTIFLLFYSRRGVRSLFMGNTNNPLEVNS